MNKQDVKLQLETLLANENFADVKTEIKKIKDHILPILKEEENALEKKQENLDEEIEVDTENLALNNTIKDLIALYNSKLK